MSIVFYLVQCYVVLCSIAALSDYLTKLRIQRAGAKVTMYVIKRSIFDVIHSTYVREDDEQVSKSNEHIETVDTYYADFKKTQRFQCYDVKSYMDILMNIPNTTKEVYHSHLLWTHFIVALPQTQEELLSVRYTKFKLNELGDDDMKLNIVVGEEYTVLNIFDTDDSTVFIILFLFAPVKCVLFIKNLLL